MLGIVFISALLFLGVVVYFIRGQREYLRESVLIGFVIWGSGIFLATEFLSLVHALGFWEVLIFWMTVLVICFVFMVKQKGHIILKELFFVQGRVRSVDQGVGWLFLEKASFNRIIFLAISLGLIAAIAPPNTYDAMTYHLSRVMHWIQDHGIMYYPTHIPRELYMPNFPEYVILHFQLLSGGDYWANLVQWLSMCGSLVAVSLIAKELEAKSRGQIFSALIAVTIPMGVLQATSTQTDYVGILWTGSFIYFLLCWRRSFGWGYVLLAGISLGLAIDTKGVALIFAAPFLAWILLENIFRMKIRQVLMIVMMFSLVGVFYAGTFYRNTVFFNGNASKVLSADADSLINKRFCWEGFEANALRNVGLHLSTPWTSVNMAIEHGIGGIASLLHVDLNNRDWSYIGHSFAVLSFRSDEDLTGNLLHLLLYAVIFALFLIFPRFRNRDAAYYLIAFCLGGLAFNLILKWQPWHSRFHLTMFVLFAPLAGLVMEKIKTRWVVAGVMGALFLSAWVIIFLNVSKPIFNGLSIFNPQNRPGLYFLRTESPQSIYLEYDWIGKTLKKMGCKNIGLIMGSDENEYLLWTALNPTSDPMIRIESVLVKNSSGDLKYPLGDFLPDAIIAINDDRTMLSWGNSMYQAVWHQETASKRITILMKNSYNEM